MTVASNQWSLDVMSTSEPRPGSPDYLNRFSASSRTTVRSLACGVWITWAIIEFDRRSASNLAGPWTQPQQGQLEFESIGIRPESDIAEPTLDRDERPRLAEQRPCGTASFEPAADCPCDVVLF